MVLVEDKLIGEIVSFTREKLVPSKNISKEGINELWRRRILRKWILRNCPDLLYETSIKWTYFIPLFSGLDHAGQLVTDFYKDEETHFYNTYYTEAYYEFNEEDTKFDEEFNELLKKEIERRRIFPIPFYANKYFFPFKENNDIDVTDINILIFISYNRDIGWSNFLINHMISLKNQYPDKFLQHNVYYNNIFTGMILNPVTSLLLEKVKDQLPYHYYFKSLDIFNIPKRISPLYLSHYKEIFEEIIPEDVIDKSRSFKYNIDRIIYNLDSPIAEINCEIIRKKLSRDGYCIDTESYVLMSILKKRVSSYISLKELNSCEAANFFFDDIYGLVNPNIEIINLCLEKYIDFPVEDKNPKTRFLTLSKLWAKQLYSSIKKHEFSEEVIYHRNFDNSIRLRDIERINTKTRHFRAILNLNRNSNDMVIDFLIENPRLIIVSSFSQNPNPRSFWFLNNNKKMFSDTYIIVPLFCVHPELIYESRFLFNWKREIRKKLPDINMDIIQIPSKIIGYFWSLELTLLTYFCRDINFPEKNSSLERKRNIPQIYFTILNKSPSFTKVWKN